jgi:hypothetical protein
MEQGRGVFSDWVSPTQVDGTVGALLPAFGAKSLGSLDGEKFGRPPVRRLYVSSKRPRAACCGVCREPGGRGERAIERDTGVSVFSCCEGSRGQCVWGRGRVVVGDIPFDVVAHRG